MREASSSGKSSSRSSGLSASMRELGRAICYGSTLPVRFILFLSSLLWGIGIATISHANWSGQRAFQAMILIGGQKMWASAFLLLAFCLAWRIVDYRARIGWSHFVNSLSFGFWMAVTFLRLWNRLEIWPVMCTDVSLCVLALWVSLRTSLTSRDRETA